MFNIVEDFLNEVVEDIYINWEVGGWEVVVLIDDIGLCCVVYLILNFLMLLFVKYILFLK